MYEQYICHVVLGNLQHKRNLLEMKLIHRNYHIENKLMGQ
jgi:hypothetical protein